MNDVSSSAALQTGSRFGPVIEDGSVLFQLWAPRAREVLLCVEGQPPQSLCPSDDGFWTGRHQAMGGTRYRFRVDDRVVPDPASRFQPDDVNGPSQIIDSTTYRWQNETWRGRVWEETVLYELHAGIIGGYTAISARLAELAGIGITAIQLMPLADFAGARNWGYDGALPYAPDHTYGTPDELRALIDAAHGNNLMVFLDVVYNHFGPEGNYLPAYAPEVFDTTHHTPWGPAIDFRNPQVRRFFIDNALYWLTEFRFDGLRFDAVHAISERDWLIDLAASIRSAHPTRHVHLVVENENNDAPLLQSGFTAQWNDDFHNVMHVLLTGETHSYYQSFADHPAEHLARCLAEGFVYQGEPSPHHDGRTRGTASAHLRPTAFVNFLQNHDQTGNRAFGERLTCLTVPAALRAAFALLLLSPHIPMLFMGEEFGAREPFLFFTDFAGALGVAVREGRRREFAGTPGFTDEQAWNNIPDPNDIQTFVAAAWTEHSPDAGEWRALTECLLRLRHEIIVPRLTGTRSLGAAAVNAACVRATWRMGNDDVLTLICNLGPVPVTLDHPPGPPLFGVHPKDGEIGPYSTLAWIST